MSVCLLFVYRLLYFLNQLVPRRPQLRSFGELKAMGPFKTGNDGGLVFSRVLIRGSVIEIEILCAQCKAEQLYCLCGCRPSGAAREVR